jgi:NADPH:quinone reductase-like Zn-dependent oxidoreductase
MKMQALRFARYGPPSVLTVEEGDVPMPGLGEVLIQVKASAINPSDIRNVEGVFHTPLPRTPGRDDAGIVVGGDAAAGLEVWGSGPRFGIACDGAHADYAVIAADWVSEKPAGLSMEQASSVGVPFITAWSALVTEGRIQAGETILIIGAAGAVGRAATQIAAWKGARVIPAFRAKGEAPAGTIDTQAPDMPAAVRTLTGGKGADLVLDTVGGALFEPALTSLRVGGRHLAIVSRGMRRVSFDLTDFYHNRTHLIGVDSLGLNGAEIAAIMDALRPGFEAGALRPFDVTTWPLARAVEAYEAADRDGARAKHVLLPG